MGYVHKLPTEAEATGANEVTHVRLEREIREPGYFIHRMIRYGRTDADGNFVPDEALGQDTFKLVISDMETFNNETSSNSTAPDNRGNSVEHLDKDTAEFADSHSKWHSNDWS